MSNLTQLIDMTSLNGVESIFRKHTCDPWGPRLAGRLADFFIYSDVAQFTMPTRTNAPDQMELPEILRQLQSRDSTVLSPMTYLVDGPYSLSTKYLSEAFSGFAAWTQNNRSDFHKWLVLHHDTWITDGHWAQGEPRYVFDVAHLESDGKMSALATDLGEPVERVLYGFDVVLRYPLYSIELAGPDTYFMAHPIRELVRLPTMEIKKIDEKIDKEINKVTQRKLPLSLSDAVAHMVSSMTLDQYTSFLHEARGIIRDRKIHELNPGALDRATTRDIAMSLGLPAKLSASGKVLGIAAGLITAAGALAALGPPTAVAGGLVSVASSLWTGHVGTLPTRLRWLRWALVWDIESQSNGV